MVCYDDAVMGNRDLNVKQRTVFESYLPRQMLESPLLETAVDMERLVDMQTPTCKLLRRVSQSKGLPPEPLPPLREDPEGLVGGRGEQVVERNTQEAEAAVGREQTSVGEEKREGDGKPIPARGPQQGGSPPGSGGDASRGKVIAD